MLAPREYDFGDSYMAVLSGSLLDNSSVIRLHLLPCDCGGRESYSVFRTGVGTTHQTHQQLQYVMRVAIVWNNILMI